MAEQYPTEEDQKRADELAKVDPAHYSKRKPWRYNNAGGFQRDIEGERG